MTNPGISSEKGGSSFKDCLELWKSRESIDGRDGVQDSSTAVRFQSRQRSSGNYPGHEPVLSATSLNTNCDSNRKFREMKWKSEARLADRGGQKGFERTTTPLGRPRAITISQSSFRSFNTNIGYQAEAARVVSSQSVCRDKSIPSDKADKLTKQKGQDTEQKETNTYSTATDSGMHVTPSVPNSEASLIQRHHYKKKLPNKDDTARIKRRRNHNKPKSESGNEMALLHKSFRPSESNSKSKEIHTDEGFGIEICRPLSVSQQSLQYYKDDDSVFNADVGTADSRSHPLGPQTNIRIDNSSQVYVNTVGVAGNPESVPPFDHQSFGPSPSRNPMSVSSGEGQFIRKEVADITRKTLKVHKNSMASVKTKRLDEAKKQLQQNSFLILIGYDGEGVTTLGYDLLLDYPDRDQYIVMERKETLPCMTQTDDKQIIMFADDVFGTTYFDEKRYEGWCRNMNQIQKLMKHNGDILILALHTKFLKVGKCKSFCDHYQEHILNISELNLQLDFKERQRMLKCNIISQMEVLHIQVCKTEGQESVARINEDTGFIGTKISEQTIDDIARLSLASGFPRMVGNYLTSVDNVKKGVRYFTIPTKEMYEEIESFRMAKTKEDCDIYLALVAVFIYGKLNYDTFEIDCQYLAKSEKTLRTYLAKRTGRSQNFDQTTKLPAMINVLTGFAKKYECMPSLAGTVKRGISEMLGRYIKIKEHTRGHYVLASASVEKAVAVSCANVYPIDICKYSSKSVFRDITGPDHAFEKTEIHISVEEKDKSMCLAAMERLHLVVTSNKILEFIQHPAVRVAWFAKLFIKQLQKEKHALKAFVMKRDENSKASLLSLSLQYPYKSPRKFSSQCLTEDLMLSQKWPSIKRDYPEFAKENQQEYLEKCCEMGWTESYFRAVEKLELLPSKACLSLTVNSKHSENIHILKDVSRNKTLPMDDWYRALRQTCEKYVENDRDRMNMIRFIKKMVPFDYKSEAVESIIHTAGRKGDIILLSKVMSFYEDKDFTNQDGLTCLHLATQGNHLDFVKYALKNGVSQRVPDSKGELPIHYACRLGFIDIIELFVKQDTKVVHYMSHSKSTPLHLSAENAHFEITMFLVSNGAKLEANDINGRTPSYCAARYGTSIVLEYLLEKEMHNHLGNPALSVTCKNTRSPDEKPVLLRKRKILERKQNLLTTCLIDIVRENCHESDKKDEIMHMLNMGVNLNYVKEEVPPLLQLGIESECSVTMIEFLLNNGASASQRNLQTYDNALHKAVKNGNSDIVRLLLRDYTENKNLLWQRNKGNKTPLHTAVEKGYVELVELMKTESKTIKHAAKMGRCKTPLGLSEEKQRQLEDRFEWQKHEEVLI